ncbi:hypothetical protein [Paraburkholderia sp. BL17N1]|uniref:hypothetical protein n=1 Tax=Paraburkholderia sp. BL17N1 TaxID=1938798 RepID=UPI000EAB48A3|nr:hypothetical protein [Paraburkholderia sp. BL17N1]RKR31523.1 hypothetical protein B0G82_7702 [Paraburkholderia sp. BL17N1]
MPVVDDPVSAAELAIAEHEKKPPHLLYGKRFYVILRLGDALGLRGNPLQEIACGSAKRLKARSRR